MSGYVERTYLFEGGTVPGKFFDDVYNPSWGAKHLKVVESGVTNWGDDTEVVVSADCEETLDDYLHKWEGNIKK